MMTLLYYITAISILLYWYFRKTFNYWRDKNVPFVKPLPIVGNALNAVLLRSSFGEIFHEFYQKTKEPVFGIYLLHKPALLIRCPKIIKRICISDFQFFYDRNVLNNKRDDPISTHILFFLKNPEWKAVRGKVCPVYSSAKIKALSSLIQHSASELNNYLIEELKKNPIIDMKNLAIKFTVDVITSTAFGVDSNAFKDQKAPFFVAAQRMVNWDDFVTSFRIRSYFLFHSVVKILRLKLFNPTSIKFLEENFWAIMNQRIKSKVQRNDLIDILLQLKNDTFLDGDILTSQAVVFFGAGFETTSSTIGFILHELALHPEIQTKLREEINEVSNKHGGINYEAIQSMIYLDMVFREALRKYPIVPVLERKCNSQYTIPETGTVLDKDTPVFIPVWSLHHDPEYYPDPEKFDPERFATENLNQIRNFTYLPFGEGPRNCIGARFGKLVAKIGVANIVQNFTLEPSELTPEKLEFNPKGFVLSAVDGVKLKVTRIREF